MHRPSTEALVNLMNVGGMRDRSEVSVKKSVEVMLDWGHRYANMEQSLGNGITFFLGTNLPES